MLVARHNAVEISGWIARRFDVYAAVVVDGAVVRQELSPVPVEELQLPLPRPVATHWANEHFEDLSAAEFRELIRLLTQPIGRVV